ATARPSPREPPVTRMTRPARSQFCGRRARCIQSNAAPAAIVTSAVRVFMLTDASINRAECYPSRLDRLPSRHGRGHNQTTIVAEGVEEAATDNSGRNVGK